MSNIRFVEGTANDFSTVYDCEWPIVPRVGELLSARVAAGAVLEWKITRVCHVVGADMALIRTLAWIEQSPGMTSAREEDWMASYDHADNDDPFEGSADATRYSTPTD
jgi:hypothetical protein